MRTITALILFWVALCFCACCPDQPKSKPKVQSSSAITTIPLKIFIIPDKDVKEVIAKGGNLALMIDATIPVAPIGVRIFLDNPYADLYTSLDDPSYVGSFVRGGEPKSTSSRYIFDVTEVVKELKKKNRLKGEDIAITLIISPLREGVSLDKVIVNVHKVTLYKPE